jgi:hypothetical protein
MGVRKDGSSRPAREKVSETPSQSIKLCDIRSTCLQSYAEGINRRLAVQATGAKT